MAKEISRRGLMRIFSGRTEDARDRPPVGAPEAYRDLLDEELAARLAYRDMNAFEALYDRHGDLVYSVALRVLGDTHLAQDVAQEVFLRLWRSPERFLAERGRFLNWLLSVARNRAVDEIRRRGRRFRHESPAPEPPGREVATGNAHDPALGAQLADERRVVRAALGRLPAEQRQVIELAYFGGLTQQEIANHLRQPLGTVKTRIRLGMQKLKTALSESRGKERL